MVHMAEDKQDVGGAESTPPSILAKAFLVIGAFNERDRVLTLTQISRKTGLPKSTVHRLLQRLGELDVIEEHGAGYRLGIRLLQLVSSMPVDGMREVALPHLAQLQAWSKESVHFGVLRGNEVVVLQALFAVDHARPIGEVGTRIPAHLSAMGRAMMAYLREDELTELLSGPLVGITPKSITDPARIREELKQVRVSGVAVQKDGVVLGLGNIAAPVLIKGRPMGAVAVQFDSSKQVSESVINAVKLTAHRICSDTTQMLAQGRGDLFPFDD
ncbi:IclR family transcriptional regulator [Rhodococcus wratislaviensis]|jgi:DNA-binding IclR family transcriptional regulator|uniref:IclR family transcriptional regulator n=2 Tax=Nocardiaceae TaxID=85025 RepID=A0A076EYR7_RHOOP|nr:IclR family transcriptional regulator [Rhodococcus opacus]EJI98989.1 bacterial transcriptional regulator family protein [Rhodococcus sp. JVH1]MDH6288437.1 DNA-binding IclR family transcriptional regulator [Rhodococcus opacus]